MRYGPPRFPPGPRGNGPPGHGRFPHMAPRPMRPSGNSFRGGRPRQPFQGQRGAPPMKQKPTVPVRPTVAENKSPASEKFPKQERNQAPPVKPSPVKSENPPQQQKPPQNATQPKPQPLLQQQVTPTQRSNQAPQNRYPPQDRNAPNSGNSNKRFQQNQQNWKQQDHQNSGGPKNYYDKVKDKIQALNGPQYDLPALDMSEKKFNSSSRLFVGNLVKGVPQEEVQNMFSKYGECTIYLAKDATYAFVNFDYRANALKALRETNGTVFKGRFIQVRFAAVSEGIRVKNLSRIVSNELLEKAFSIFGQVETARIIVDDRAMTKGEAIVIFKEKKSAIIALKRCQEECYIITGTARPVVVTPLESTEDNEDGYPETSVPRNEEYQTDRRHGPHFSAEGSYEHDFCLEWKKIYQALDEKKKQLDDELAYEIERLEKKMVLARVEFEKDNLRRELAAREAEAVHLRRRFGPETEFAEEPMPFGGLKRNMDSSYDNYRQAPYDGGYDDSYERGPPASDFDSSYSRPPPYGRDSYEGRFPPERMGPPRGDFNDYQTPKRPRY